MNGRMFDRRLSFFLWMASPWTLMIVTLLSIGPCVRSTVVVYEYLDVLYRMFQEEESIFLEVIVLVTLSNKMYMYTCPIPNCFRESYFTVQFTVHCTDEQHAMSSHELQSALMLTVEFSKMLLY
jgi:hypothetical protein